MMQWSTRIAIGGQRFGFNTGACISIVCYFHYHCTAYDDVPCQSLELWTLQWASSLVGNVSFYAVS